MNAIWRSRLYLWAACVSFGAAAGFFFLYLRERFGF